MAGLNHDFLVIESGSFSLDNYDLYSKSNLIEIHDDLLGYFADSLSWASSYNPCTEEETVGLCWYGPTIIEAGNIDKFSSIISGWLQILSEAPDIVALKGGWTWTEGESSETGNYEKLSFSKKGLVDKLSKLVSFCVAIKESGGSQCLLHLGI
ncbi:hypothetical protein A9Q81_13170 [Gammaproteobacteria bacterium 42_54_T18]|nr:hypothetical protein A9Q81_13170 [Gammaproteobacteria bacterium 42_54_T18]